MNETSTTTTTQPGIEGLHIARTDSNNGDRNNLINTDLLDKLVAGITSPRDKALALLMIDTGLRVGEVVGLNIDSIEFGHSQDSCSGMTSGNRKTEEGISIPGRRFYFTARTAAALAAYGAKRGDDVSPALFVDKKGARLRSHSVSHIMHRWCDQLGIERFPLHHLRSHLATCLIEGGCDLVSLQALLGHSNIQTTIRLYSKPYPRLDLMVD
jgi:site-specific recombinase XerC